MTKPKPAVIALIGGEHVDLSKVTLPSTEEVRELLREAWVLDGTAIEINMPAARAIARAWIETARASRQPIMNDRFMAALQDGVDPTSAAADAKWMRAIGADQRIDAARTPEALKEALDAILAEIAEK